MQAQILRSTTWDVIYRVSRNYPMLFYNVIDLQFMYTCAFFRVDFILRYICVYIYVYNLQILFNLFSLEIFLELQINYLYIHAKIKHYVIYSIYVISNKYII